MSAKKPHLFAFCAVPLALAALVQSPALAQKKPAAKTTPAANLPKAEVILDKYVEATGGKAAYEKITSTSTKATMTVAAAGISGTVEAYAKAPNKFYMAQTLTGIGKSQQGYDGTTGWSKDPLGGFRVLAGTELDQFKTEAVFNAPVRWREVFSKAETIGMKNVEGKPTYVVRLTSKASGKTRTEYYSTRTGLQIKSEAIQETPQGTFPVETYYSDYRDVNGVKIPWKVRASVAGTELLSTITEYKNNVPVDDALFTKPTAAAAPVAPVAPVAPLTPAEPAAPAAPAAPATP